MTLKENIKAILECNFSIAKDEVIEAATKRIMEQIERQNPVEDINIKQCGGCKYCKPCNSIFDAGVGYCTKTDERIRVSLGLYCCDEYEEGETNDGI